MPKGNEGMYFMFDGEHEFMALYDDEFALRKITEVPNKRRFGRKVKQTNDLTQKIIFIGEDERMYRIDVTDMTTYDMETGEAVCQMKDFKTSESLFLR